ncbi:MAG: acyl carrier protein, partial [Moorea sp. SIO3G5]|nr:acyl carrier protein [Moorena sp. SIO3G5]
IREAVDASRCGRISPRASSTPARSSPAPWAAGGCTARSRLEATAPNERRSLLVAHVRRQLALVLGINNPESIALATGFFDLGMDSLSSVELRNKLQSSLDCSLPSSLAFDYPKVEKLVDYLVKYVVAKEYYDTLVTKPTENKNDQKQEKLLTNTKELSEEQLEELINQEFSLLIDE